MTTQFAHLLKFVRRDAYQKHHEAVREFRESCLESKPNIEKKNVKPTINRPLATSVSLIK